MSVRWEQRRDAKSATVKGFWLVDVDFEHADGRRERVRKVSPVPTRRGAEEYERQLRAALLRPLPPPAKEVPRLDAFMQERWLPKDAEATNRPATIAEKKSHMRLHILPQLGRLHLDKIGAEEITSFFAYLASRGLGAKSRKNIAGTLRRALACAVEWELIARVPRFPRLSVPDSKWDFFNRDETDKLLSVVRDPFDRALLLFAFRTGARSGEQIAFTWGDIDWHNRLVIFRQASSRGTVGPTKSGRERRVTLTPELAEALRNAKHLRSDLVFCQQDGKPLNLWHLRRCLERYCRLAGLRRIRRHDTRHSFASQLVMAGVPLPRVQELLGHSTIAMTMKYAHLSPTTGAEVIDAFEGRRAVSERQPDGNGVASASY